MADLGIIEGYFGTPWQWEARTEVMKFLSQNSFNFFIYAPKNDKYLRDKWRTPYPAEKIAELYKFSNQCLDSNVSFGIGLSPLQLFEDFNSSEKSYLKSKISALEQVGVTELSILFDDMKGNIPDIAIRQAEIVNWVHDNVKNCAISMCPTYYTDEKILDRIFGQRPERYLEDLGSNLHPDISVFWTGEEVCAYEISAGHLADVNSRLGRKVRLWDNYPVNDDKKMSNFLHLRSFTGRSHQIESLISGHAINPALQPWLSCIPALTLRDCYYQKDNYQYMKSFYLACDTVLGSELSNLVKKDYLLFNNVGYSNLGNKLLSLRSKYASIIGKPAEEIQKWLSGGYVFDANLT